LRIAKVKRGAQRFQRFTYSDHRNMLMDEIALLNDAMEKDEPEIIEDKTGMPRVLLVEDDEEVLEMLVNIFSPTYTVYKATNGQVGFEMTQQWHPDIVVSDVMMPVMSGKEMCYKIKNCLELAYMPVVLLTAQTSEDCTIEGYMFGADDYITKPFNVKLL
ncbi:MAG: response regulator, partial [Bacteroides cellulosilyticus]